MGREMAKHDIPYVNLAAQGQDQLDVFRPTTKWSGPIFDWSRIVEVTAIAFRAGQSELGRALLDPAKPILHVAGALRLDRYRGRDSVRLQIDDAMMQELRSDNIRVSCVLPGSTATGFGGRSSGADWKLAPEDVARAVIDLIGFPPRSLPSRLELRPSRPAAK